MPLCSAEGSGCRRVNREKPSDRGRRIHLRPSANDVYLNLNDLALRTGERYERSYPLEIAPIIFGGAPYQVLLPRGMTLVVERIAGGFLVTLSADAKVYGSCARCLNEVTLELQAEQQEFVPTAKDGWQESDLSDFIEGMVVDIAGIAREAVILALPSQIVCSSSCPGLCPLCGHDLNKGPCECASSRVDERWDKLKDLRLPDDTEA